MSLQVWLPLNGDLHNQGLANINFINSNATVDNNGKIGKCYNFNASAYLYENTFNWTNFNTSQFSLCCWYKEPSPVASGNSQIICLGTSSGWNNIRIGLLRRSSNGYPMFSVSNGTSAIQYNFTATSFALDIWNHIAVTYSNGELRMYLNGQLHKTMTTSIVPVLNSSQHLGIGAASNGAEKLTGYLNDIRIYDHALSPKEVEEIAKGLVLHYKLDNNGLGGENLFLGSAMSSINQIDMVANGNTDFTKPFRYYNGSKSIHHFSSGIICEDTITLSSAANLGIAFVRSATDINLDPTSYYTISCEAKCTKSGAGLDIGLSYYKTSNAWVWRGGTNRQLFNATDTWQKFTLTFKPDADTQYICYCFTVLGVANGTDTFTIRHCKLEKGKKATNWFFSPEDALYPAYYKSILYDSSGFNNNADVHGNLINVDSPKYQTGLQFIAENNYLSHEKVLFNNLNQFTLSIWIQANATGYPITSLQTGMGYFRWWINGANFYIRDDVAGDVSGSSKSIAIGSWTNGDWHHIAITFNNGVLKSYHNGVLYSTANTDGTYTSFNILNLGGRKNTGNYKFSGNLSDFRFYITELSNALIKELYDTSVTIDANNNVYARELIEI